MWIFIPVFAVLFIVIPAFLTKMAADLIGIPDLKLRLVIFLVISGLNWQMWQIPKPPVDRVWQGNSMSASR